MSSPSWFSRLRHHAIFPVLLYLPLSQALRDNYPPVSHFPMYSNPTSKPLKIHSLTDGEGKLIPIMPRTGVTPSHMSKMYGGYFKDMLEADLQLAKKEQRDPRPESDFEIPAAEKVLKFLRKQSLKRSKKQHLIQALQLRETQVSCGVENFDFTEKVLFTLPAQEAKQP